MDDSLINGGKRDVESIFDFRSDRGNREQDGRISAGSGRQSTSICPSPGRAFRGAEHIGSGPGNGRSAGFRSGAQSDGRSKRSLLRVSGPARNTSGNCLLRTSREGGGRFRHREHVSNFRKARGEEPCGPGSLDFRAGTQLVRRANHASATHTICGMGPLLDRSNQDRHSAASIRNGQACANRGGGSA